MGEVPKAGDAGQPTERLNAQEQGLKRVMTEIFMAEKPGKIGKEQLAHEAEELKKLGFGECTIKVSADGHKVAIIGADGKSVLVDDKGFTDDKSIKKYDAELLKHSGTGEADKKAGEAPEPDKKKTAKVNGKKVEGRQDQDVQGNSETTTATFGKDDGAQVTVSHDKKHTFVPKTAAEAARPVGTETNQSTNATVTGTRDFGAVQVEGGVSTTDARNHSVHTTVSRDLPDAVGGTASYCEGNDRTRQVSYTRPFGADSDNPRGTMTIDYDIYNKQASFQYEHKVTNRIRMNVNVTPRDKEAHGHTTATAGVTIRM